MLPNNYPNLPHLPGGMKFATQIYLIYLKFMYGFNRTLSKDVYKCQFDSSSFKVSRLYNEKKLFRSFIPTPLRTWSTLESLIKTWNQFWYNIKSSHIKYKALLLF